MWRGTAATATAASQQGFKQRQRGPSPRRVHCMWGPGIALLQTSPNLRTLSPLRSSSLLLWPLLIQKGTLRWTSQRCGRDGRPAISTCSPVSFVEAGMLLLYAVGSASCWPPCLMPTSKSCDQVPLRSASTGCLDQHHTVLAPAVANDDLLILCCSRPSSVPVAAKARARCSSDSGARGQMCLKKAVKVAPPWGS